MMNAPIKVYTQFDRPPTVATCSGNQYEEIDELCVDDDGVQYLRKTGEKVDIQAKINSNMGVTFFDLAEAYSRYLNGDAEALILHPQCFYGDVSNISDLLSVVKTNEDLHQKISDADSQFVSEHSSDVSPDPEPESVADV